MTDQRTVIAKFYDDYLAAFNRGDAQAVASYYANPCLFITAESVTHMSSASEVVAMFESIIAQLRRRDYSHSAMERLDITPRGEHLAEITGIAIRYAADGNMLERLGASYTLRNAARDWQIVSATAYALA